MWSVTDCFSHSDDLSKTISTHAQTKDIWRGSQSAATCSRQASDVNGEARGRSWYDVQLSSEDSLSVKPLPNSHHQQLIIPGNKGSNISVPVNPVPDDIRKRNGDSN